MANTIDSQLLQDGEVNVVLKYTATLTADLTNVVLIDAATLAKTAAGQPNKLREMQVDYIVSDGLTITTTWNGGTPKQMETFYGRGVNKHWRFSGLFSDAVTPNGQILISTTGTGTGASFTLIYQFKKQFPNT